MLVDLNVSESAAAAPSMTNKFLSDDGMLNVAMVERLSRKILTAAKKMDAPVIQGVYYTRKELGTFSKAKFEKKDHEYLASRAFPVKTNQRVGKNITIAQAPKMVKGVTLLVDVQGLPKDLEIEMAQFVTACNRHNKKILPVTNKVRDAKAKIRAGMQKDFDKALKKAEALFAGKEIVENMSPFGKTAIIKIDADTFLSIGPSSKEKFALAKKKAADAAVSDSV